MYVGYLMVNYVQMLIKHIVRVLSCYDSTSLFYSIADLIEIIVSFSLDTSNIEFPCHQLSSFLSSLNLSESPPMTSPQ